MSALDPVAWLHYSEAAVFLDPILDYGQLRPLYALTPEQVAVLEAVARMAEVEQREAVPYDRTATPSEVLAYEEYLAARGALMVALGAPCPTCSGWRRTTVGMVCETCGTDYAPLSTAEGAQA